MYNLDKNKECEMKSDLSQYQGIHQENRQQK
jgi:hypothetical protein